jgi:signal peptidase II
MRLPSYVPRVAGISAGVLILDWITKQWALRSLALGESIVIAPFFYLTHVHNTGSAFGLFQNNNWVLLGIALVIFGLLLAAVPRLIADLGCWAEIGIGLVLGGALGNIIDRLRFGYVVDFFDFRVWPVFNIADSAISVGTVLLAWRLWFRKR